MKKWKKLTALLLAMVMVLGLTGTALAKKAECTDVPAWAKDYVDAAAEAGLIDGKTATTFAPNDPMTRADLAEALYRLAGKPAVSGKNPFTDVAGNAACKNAVIWVSQKGILEGKNASGTVFDPTGSVTRQEVVKILNLFAASQVGRKELSNRIDELSGYPDAANVASWAKDCMNWAVASEFIVGSGGKLLPEGTATRAQVAAILCRYMDDNSTGDAARDNPRNQDNIGENELLVVSFGTSYNDNRVATIGAIENALEKAFPDCSVRRGFTANIIIEHVYRRDGETIDGVKEALDRAVKNGVKNLLVQPTHLMNGYEYGDLRNLLEKKYADKFETIRIGAPLLTSDDDFARVAEAMVSATASAVRDNKTAVCYMGHGTSADSHSIYARMQQILKDTGHDNYFIGTVEAPPMAEDLVELVKKSGYEKVVLRPMMIVAGDHANNDMADPDDEESWYSVFSAAGLEVVECQINGLGEIEAVQQLLVEHAKNARPLNDTGITSQPNPENPDNEELEKEVEKPAKTEALADGVYTIEVECEQSMFKIDGCQLTVKDGKMTAALTLGSTSFDKMFAGKANAAKLAAEGVVDAVESDGKTTFTLTVAALDQALDYAAHSVNRDTWYDRTLTFVSATAVAE